MTILTAPRSILGYSIVGEEIPLSQLSRLKRPTLLAILGVTMVTAGTVAGLWLRDARPEKTAGDHSSPGKMPGPDSIRKSPEDQAAFTSLLTPSEIDTAPTPSPWNEAATKTDQIANHVSVADEALRTGNYSKAISVYRSLLPYIDGAHEAAVRFRLALASECSGAFKDALRQYQAIAQKFAQSNWNDIAQLGRVRCLAHSARNGLLDTVVYRNLILDNTTLTVPIRREVLHAAARGLCGTLLNERRMDILDPATLLLSAWHVDPNVELTDLPELLKASSTPPGAPAFEMLQRIDNDPDNIYFRIQTRGASLQGLLARLTTRAKLGLRLSPAATELIESRKQAIHADDIQMSLLLDGLCAPFGLEWHMDESTVVIAAVAERSDDENGAFLLARVLRLLEEARLEAADSRQAGHTSIAYGCLLFETGRPADAANIFNNQLQSGTSDEVDIEAAFNLGKCYQALAQGSEAEEAWYRCVDTGGKDRITRAAAYICLSRVQLEDGRFQKAASSLVPALALASGTVLEQEAAAMLGSAYLLAGNAPAANSVMFEHRDSMEDEQIRNAVAFVAALARYQVEALAERREIEARDVVATLSHYNPSTSFGAHWYVLAGQACEELGLADRAVGHYVEAVQNLNEGGLRKQTMLKLAEQYRNDHRLQDAGKILQAVSTGEHGPLADEVRLQKADIALRQGDTQATIDQCYLIAINSTSESVHRRSLYLMGRAFEKRKDYESAVSCFAGMLPHALTASAVRPAGHRGLK